MFCTNLSSSIGSVATINMPKIIYYLLINIFFIYFIFFLSKTLHTKQKQKQYIHQLLTLTNISYKPFPLPY